MDVSDIAQQAVAMQMQMLRTNMATAVAKSNAEQQQAATTLLTEATQAAAASADGKGTMLDILV